MSLLVVAQDRNRLFKVSLDLFDVLGLPGPFFACWKSDLGVLLFIEHFTGLGSYLLGVLVDQLRYLVGVLRSSGKKGAIAGLAQGGLF